MADQTHLVTWAGQGEAVTFSTSGNHVDYTPNKHGIKDESAGAMPVYFTTTGSFPTVSDGGDAFSGSVKYWGAYKAADTFNLYRTEANAQTNDGTGLITFSGAGSGCSVVGAYWNDLPQSSGANYKDRYDDGASGYYVHSTFSDLKVNLFNSGTQDPSQSILVELQGNWVDYNPPDGSVDTEYRWGGYFSIEVTTELNGTRDSLSFHNGAIGDGLRWETSFDFFAPFYCDGNRTTLDGFEIRCASDGAPRGSTGIRFDGALCRADKMISQGSGALTNEGYAFYEAGSANVFESCIAWGGDHGFYTANGAGIGTVFANCLAFQCARIGFDSHGSGNSDYVNCISFDNVTTNWGTEGTGYSNYNGGETGDSIWTTSGGTNITGLTSAMFTDYNAGALPNDLTPSSGAAATVDAGFAYFDQLSNSDIADGYKPSYDAGVGTYDIGPFEYGNVEPPVTTGIEFTGVVTGSSVSVFTTGTQTVLFNSTSAYDWEETTTQGTVDYTILKVGYAPLRVTGVIVGSSKLTTPITQVEDPVYNSGHSLTYGADPTGDFTYNPTTRVVTIDPDPQEGRNIYSAMIAYFTDHSNTAVRNMPFPLVAYGPDRIDFTSDGSTAATVTPTSLWRGAGMEWEHATTGNPTHKFCSIKGTGTNTAGTKGYFQQEDGAAPTALTLVSNNIDQVIQYYRDDNGDGDTSDANEYDYSGHLVLKLFNAGHYQVAANILTAYGISAVESFEYTVPMQMTSTGLSIGSPGLTITLTDNTPGGVEEEPGYTFDFKIEGGAADSPEDLLRQFTHDIYTDPTAQTYSTANLINFNLPDPIVESGGNYETQRGYVYGSDTTTTYSGFYVEEGSAAHPDFLQQQANDGTYYVTPVTAQISVTGMPDAAGGNNNLQIVNKTGLEAGLWTANTATSVGDVIQRNTLPTLDLEDTTEVFFRATSVAGDTQTGATEPATWDVTPGNTTVDDQVTWTAYKIVHQTGDPASTAYADSYTNGEEFYTGETARVRFSQLDGSANFKTDEQNAVISASGFSVVVSASLDSVYGSDQTDDWVTDGSAVTKFSANYTDDYVHVASDSDYIGEEAYAFYCYQLTTDDGIHTWWGGVTAIDSGNYRINQDVMDIIFDSPAGANYSVKQTDASRIFRADGAYPVKDPTTSGYGMQVNWQLPVHVVEIATSGSTSKALVKEAMTEQGYTTTRGPKLDNLDAATSKALTVPEFLGLK